jgi:hypothetical protein
LIHRAPRPRRQFFEPNPDEQGTPDVVALDARLPALAPLQAGQLLPLAVQLLDLPAEAARLLCRLRGVLS